ncbi:hypothetical protein GCM10023172_25300 [Hymenobacter ginsengisoli]|uniref:TonB-dependent receptor plug domain-containing protein n=1 Tax=Hymenobacter ginsengisoli TaxID=1051626 RepID=A0ABP8QJS9_9BACT|nr:MULTISPECIES: TonB-dependent receptor [unclassified Hymenobacter]MBO2030211.1 TonB-dependent receptor [Hymenobacter sp. BT559]
MLQPAGVRAQTPTVSGLQIQPAPPPSAGGLRITLDGPRPKSSLSVIYLDGQRADTIALAKLNPDDIASVSVLKDGAIARQLGPDETRLGVLFITSKANEHSHRVRAFNRRLARLKQAEAQAPAGRVAP